jgi:hypothetical protein
MPQHVQEQHEPDQRVHLEENQRPGKPPGRVRHSDDKPPGQVAAGRQHGHQPDDAEEGEAAVRLGQGQILVGKIPPAIRQLGSHVH